MSAPTPAQDGDGFGKLTNAQVKFLSELRDEVRFGARCANLGNRTAEALRKRGLTEWKPGHHWGGRYHITETGRRALAKGPSHV